MVQKFAVEGFDAFVEKLESVQTLGKDIYLMFSGSVDPNTGNSWCPDCVVAKPVVEAALPLAPADSIFIYVEVGGRDFWKDPNCIFRTDSRTRLKTVPTLLKFGAPQRLEEGQCAQSSLVQMFFEE